MLLDEIAPPLPVSPPKPKRSLLPVLTVLFVISYSLLAMLVIEQGSTITSQRWLIQQLFADSTELMSLKKQAQQQRNAEAQTQAPAPKTQSQIPSIQVTPQDQAKGNDKARKPLPLHPPKPAADAADARRAVVTI